MLLLAFLLSLLFPFSLPISTSSPFTIHASPLISLDPGSTFFKICYSILFLAKYMVNCQ